MKTRSFSSVLESILLSLILTASISCEGGGGDGGGAPAPPAPTPVTYTGITTQATITEANAEDLALAALGAGQIGLAAGVSMQEQVFDPRYLKLVRALRDSTVDIELTTLAKMAAGAIVPISYSESGNCGGSLSLTGTLDDQTGSTSGTLTYNNFCSDGDIMNGVCNFSGTYNLSAQDFDVLTLNSDSLNGTFNGVSFTTRFTNITFDYRPFPNVATMESMMIRDEASKKVYWAEDYVMNVWDYPGMTYSDMSLTGKSYHPDYGYVNASTPTKFSINDLDDYPYQGVLLCEGQPGTAGGNTTTQLTALSATTYRVVADTDGDTEIEWDSGLLNW